MNTKKSPEYIDLGLPSGTLWRKYNEIGDYTYNEAVSQFGNALPTKEQFEELKKECKWKWQTNRYKVTGPNSNSIILHATGYRDVSGEVCLVGSRGSYWSSTPYGSRYACSLGFNSYHIYMFYGNRDCGRSVRLVKNNNSNLNQQ